MMWLAAALGGTIGTLARHAVNVAFARAMRPVPLATATVNIVGSLIIGMLAGAIASGRLLMAPPVRAFVFVGILGGFTTFSSFMLDTFALADGGSPLFAFANVTGQVLAGIAATYLGYRLLAN